MTAPDPAPSDLALAIGFTPFDESVGYAVAPPRDPGQSRRTLTVDGWIDFSAVGSRCTARLCTGWLPESDLEATVSRSSQSPTGTTYPDRVGYPAQHWFCSDPVDVP